MVTEPTSFDYTHCSCSCSIRIGRKTHSRRRWLRQRTASWSHRQRERTSSRSWTLGAHESCSSAESFFGIQLDINQYTGIKYLPQEPALYKEGPYKMSTRDTAACHWCRTECALTWADVVALWNTRETAQRPHRSTQSELRFVRSSEDRIQTNPWPPLGYSSPF